MNALLQRFQLVNVLVIILSVAYLIVDGEPFEDIVNLIWIESVVLFVIIPQLFYRRKYLKSFVSLAGVLIVGVLLMEMVIEGDGELVDLFNAWTWTHEFPGLFWPILVSSLLKITIDLTIRQHLMVSLEKERTDSEAKFLKSQLSPHVLFNNLNNIYSFALHKSKQTPNLILKLADVMRYMLYETKEHQVPLIKELEHLDSYVELQRLQLENRGELSFEQKGNPKSKLIAPMMLISFVENCFKHASAGSIDDLQIIIQVEIKDNQINLFTQNTYSPREGDAEDQLQEGGIGLENVKRRLELLYPNEHELIIKELSNLYIVNLSIRLKSTV
ncbi:sensor histidine kinase [Ekhidna sp.]